ncbi:hypothetical protein OIU78_019243 [Salix suchowensis]|nr:hypothetical protein OIU78_019243 [Salix suchowensis]
MNFWNGAKWHPWDFITSIGGELHAPSLQRRRNPSKTLEAGFVPPVWLRTILWAVVVVSPWASTILGLWPLNLSREEKRKK